MRPLLSACVGATLALTMSLTISQPAQALTPVTIPGTSEQLFAWSNYEAPTEDDAISAVYGMYCPSPMSTPTSSKTEAAAINRAFAALAQIESPKIIKAIAKAMKKQSVQAHRDVLLALGLGGRFGGAAIISLHLARKSKDRAHLVNAAALMLHLSRPDIAYDLLTWADRRKPGPDPDGTARAAYESAWGEILLRRGDPLGAQQRFEDAVEAAPLATSPRIGVARALACREQYDEAARWWARGQRALEVPDAFDETPAEPEVRAPDGVLPRWKVILVEPLLDPNEGIGGAKFASFDPPESANIPDDAWYTAYLFFSEALDKLSDYFPKNQPRMTWIQRAIERYASRLISEDRSIGITEDMIDVQIRNLIDEADPENSNTGCGAADNYGDFWSAVRRLYELHQDLADRRHQIFTAAALQVSTPAVNKHLNELADEYAYRAYVDWASLLGGAANLGGGNVYDHASTAATAVRANDLARLEGSPVPFPDCQSSFNGFQTAEIDMPDDPDLPGDIGPCDGMTKGYNLALSTTGKLLKKLPVSLEVKAKCDSASVELTGPKVGFPLAGLTGFLSYEDNWSDNKVEVFGGVKGIYGIEGAQATVNVGIAFVYGMGEDGPEIIDVKIKSETAIGVSEGPQGYEVKESLSVSFVTGAVGE
jgi:tetratricopeptide (TPR) repeat protein